MNEELLQNIHNHLTSNQLTDSDYETWKNNFSNDTAVRDNVHSYLMENQLTDTDRDAWEVSMMGEKKNQVETDTDSELEDGTSDSPDIRTFDEEGNRLYDFAGKKVTAEYLEGFGIPVPQTEEEETGQDKQYEEGGEFAKALGSGISLLAGQVAGLPENFAKMDFAVKNAAMRLLLRGEDKEKFEEFDAKLQALPEEKRTALILKLQSETSPAKMMFGIDMTPFNEASAKAQRVIMDDKEKMDEARVKYEGNIVEDIGRGDLGLASKRIALGITESLPIMLLTIFGGGAGLGLMGAATASGKMDEIERKGGNVDMTQVGVGLARGTAEAVGGKIMQGMFAPVVGKLAPEAAAKISKNIVERIAKNFKREFLEEGLQSVQEELTDIFAYGKMEDINWGQLFYNFLDSGLIGGFSAAPSGIVTPRIQQQGQPLVEGQTVDLDIPAVEAPVEGQRVGDPLVQPEITEPTIIMNKTKAGRYSDEVSGNSITKPTVGKNKGKWVIKKSNKIVHVANTLKAATAFQEEVNTEAQIEAKRTPIQKASNIITKGRESGQTDAQIVEGIEDAGVKRTAEIQLKNEKDLAELTPEEARRRSKELAEKAREEQAKSEEKFIDPAEKALQAAMDKFTDRQASVKRIIRKAGISRRIENLIVHKLGANAQANRINQKVEAEVFDGLSQENTRNLEEVIQQMRILSLDKNRADRGYELLEHQGGQTTESAKLALEGYKQELGEKTFKDLQKRANSFFGHYKGLLETMRREEIIDQQTYEEFAEVDYQPRKIIKFMADMEGQFMPEQLDQFESSSLADAPIQSSTTGSTESQVMDSKGLIQRSILGRTKSVFANRLNRAFALEFKDAMVALQVIQNKEAQGEPLTKEEVKRKPYLLELDRVVKDDPIVGMTESGNPKYKYEGKADGYRSLYYYVGGIRNRMLMREDFYAKFTDTGNQIINAAAREGLSVITGTRIVKKLATGSNPLFFITNVPRDLAFALSFSEAYGTNSLNILQNNIVVQGLKLGKDFLKGYYSSIARNEIYDKYFEYGGGMDFLTLQGRYGDSGVFGKMVNRELTDAFFDLKNTLPAKAINGFLNAMDRFNTASEVATRLAIFERTIKKETKKLGVESIEQLDPQQQEDLYTKAVRAAREITDFNQGGTLTKAFDAGVPYLNAATQGTRSATQAFQSRPAETFWRVFQMTAIAASGLTYGAVALVGFFRDEEEEDPEIKNMTDEELYFETLKGVSPYDLKNYAIYPMGVKDANGNLEYYRIAKAQALTPFFGITEHVIRQQIAEAAGINYEQEDWIKKTVNTIDENLLPVSVNPLNTFGRIPAVDALVATLGIDGYTGNVLDWSRGEIPEELEGRYNKNVEQFYKEIGDQVGYSPIRMKSAVESFITTPSTNPYVGLGYAAGELIAADEKTAIMKNFKNAALKRVKKSTSEYNRTAKLLSNIEPATVEAWKRHLDTKDAVKQAVIQSKRKESEEPLEQILEKILVEQPDLAKNAVKWAKTELEKKQFIPIINEMRFTNNKEVRAIILAKVFGDALFETDINKLSPREKKIALQLKDAGVLDKEVLSYYEKIVRPKK
jgi:hypothetical protein